ncbi:hypothetical protein JT306_02865 [Salmonella enterica subsp. enterica serovar Kentucky]|nr:hypothetical protein [Salmonella enterica subsp. enterica serovar Kentucky]
MKGSDNFNNYGREYWIMCATTHNNHTVTILTNFAPCRAEAPHLQENTINAITQ